jgi:hypothetical protein
MGMEWLDDGTGCLVGPEKRTRSLPDRQMFYGAFKRLIIVESYQNKNQFANPASSVIVLNSNGNW